MTSTVTAPTGGNFIGRGIPLACLKLPTLLYLLLVLALSKMGGAAEPLPCVGHPAEDLALHAPPINTAPGREYADDMRFFQGIPGIERAANGRLWAVWYAGGKDSPGEGAGNFVVLVTSGDDGK